MSIDEYTNNFTDKIEFALRLVPDELTKTDKYAKGLPWEYAVIVRQTPTLEAAIWAAKSVEDMTKSRAANNVEVGEKRKHEGSSKTNKESKFSKFRGGGEAKWCKGCKKEQFTKCSEEMACYKCGKTGNYTNKCASNKKVCYRCKKEGHISRDCPMKNEVARPNTPPKARAFHMILDEAENNARNRG
ncbi:uncharacterized protein LOC111886975 [Lactuca sativa]|uniref:uncharacterized protein LOC111886975 n=1 Tax=Lactuca sativa TaxID=4236 RepID=UPI0022B0429A|nr:uncharacterized protein LOC111886975 [Lactuca sativa]